MNLLKCFLSSITIASVATGILHFELLVKVQTSGEALGDCLIEVQLVSMFWYILLFLIFHSSSAEKRNQIDQPQALTLYGLCVMKRNYLHRIYVHFIRLRLFASKACSSRIRRYRVPSSRIWLCALQFLVSQLLLFSLWVFLPLFSVSSGVCFPSAVSAVQCFCLPAQLCMEFEDLGLIDQIIIL